MVKYTSLVAPSKYVQGRGIMAEAGALTKPLGKKVLFIRDSVVARLVGEVLNSSFGQAGLESVAVDFEGECSKKEIARITDIARSEQADVVAGVGGGKVIDAAKAVARPLGKAVVIIPTIAATDAPTSSLSVIYTEEGIFEEYQFFDRNPDLVLVDTEVIARAPARFLVGGMGDALATWFEAEASARAYKQAISGGLPTMTALQLARLCYETLIEYGLSAKLAVERQALTPAVEKVIEANTLLSGLGFESGGLAAAHSIHNGLTVLEATHHFYHGEKVAFGTISQLLLEERSTGEVEEVVDFCISVGLPVTLEELGIGKASREDLFRVAKAACAPGETIHNMPFEVQPEMVLDAMLAADALGATKKRDRGFTSSLPVPHRKRVDS